MVPPLSPGPSASRPRQPVSSSSSAPRASFGVSTLCNVGKSNENQDAFVATGNSSGSKCLVGVFDGHGEMGKIISEFAKTHITKSLFNHKELHSNPASALEGAYFDAQRQIERHHSGQAFHSGTTGVCAYQHRDKLVVANVGDSRAVLGQVSEGTPGGMRAIELSSDQKPARADERKRILNAGGVVQQSQHPMRQRGGPPRLMRVGPERVWDRTGCCGLCVTRSLGDLSMHPFVVANPELHERQIDPHDRLLILGSDGVWDRMRSQEAVDIAARHTDPTAAAREITEIARQRWHHETQGHCSDDITAVVAILDHSGGDNASLGNVPHAMAHAHEPPPSAPAALAAMSSTGGLLMKSRPGGRVATADSSNIDRDGIMPLNRLGATMPSGGLGESSTALRLGSRPRRREQGGQRSRKAPLHNWKGPKD